MRVTMDIELKDEPGQLIMALEPVSNHKANLISVFHYHKKGTIGDSRVQVRLVVDAKTEIIHTIKEDLESSGIRVLRVGEEKYRESLTVLLLGHVVRSDIKDTIGRIDSTGIAEVSDMALSMPEIGGPSSASLKINAVGRDEMEQTVDLLKQIAAEKSLLLILPVETD